MLMGDHEMNRIYGAFYGQIIGDALGVRYEGYDAQTAQQQMAYEKRERRDTNILLGNTPVLPILGSDPPFIKKGQFTDDSEMAISLARSIIEKQGFDRKDIACAYAYWLNVTRPKTNGLTTAYALTLHDCNLTANWRKNLTDDQQESIYQRIATNVQTWNKKSLSNGSLMRVSPLAIAFRNMDTKEQLAMEDAKLTHANPIVWDAAATYAVALASLLKGDSKMGAYNKALNSSETEVVRIHLIDAQTHALPVRLIQDIDEVDKDHNIQCQPQSIDGNDHFSGYLGVALQSAFYELLHAESFSKGLEDAIARGGDTDTNGCIVAALLGAIFGVDDIPEEWRDTVKNAEPCLLSWDDARNGLDMDFLSIKDVDVLVPKLSNIHVYDL